MLQQEITSKFDELRNSLASSIATIVTPGDAKIYSFDLFTYDRNVRSAFASNGGNITDPCYLSYPVQDPRTPVTTTAACGPIDGTTRQAANIDNFYYWDDHHPTAGVHQALGDALYSFVEASEAPEPASWAIMLAGFALTGAALRRRSAVAAVA